MLDIYIRTYNQVSEKFIYIRVQNATCLADSLSNHHNFGLLFIRLNYYPGLWFLVSLVLNVHASQKAWSNFPNGCIISFESLVAILIDSNHKKWIQLLTTETGWIGYFFWHFSRPYRNFFFLKHSIQETCITWFLCCTIFWWESFNLYCKLLIAIEC